MSDYLVACIPSDPECVDNVINRIASVHYFVYIVIKRLNANFYPCYPKLQHEIYMWLLAIVRFSLNSEAHTPVVGSLVGSHRLLESGRFLAIQSVIARLGKLTL